MKEERKREKGNEEERRARERKDRMGKTGVRSRSCQMTKFSNISLRNFRMLPFNKLVAHSDVNLPARWYHLLKKNVLLKIQSYLSIYQVSDRSRGRPEGSRFISFQISVSIPCRVTPKIKIMELDAALLNIYYYKVRIKDKMKQSRERSSTTTSASVL